MARIAVVFVALALLMSPFARAEKTKTRLAIVPLSAPSSLGGIADKLSLDIFEVASRDRGLAVVAPWDVTRTLGSEPLKNLQACGGRPECIAPWASSLSANRVVVGTLDRNENSYLVKLFLVDLRSKAIVSTVDRSILIAARRLQADLAAALPGFLAGHAEGTGKVSITTSRPDATVVLDGEVTGQTPVTLEAKPGKHILKVTKEGFLAIDRFVDVTEGKVSEVALLLTPIPGTVVTDDAPLKVKSSSPGERSSRIPTGTWISGGAAVVAAGAGAYFAVTASSLHTRAGAGPVYDITRNEALSGKRDALLANICFGVAGAAAVTAVVFALVPGREPVRDSAAPQASLAPVRGGAAFTLSSSF